MSGEAWLNKVNWSEDGLVPAIAQDAISGDILMVAWMNREALKKTVEQGEAVYWSRSRKKLWHKGEESGHTQKVKEIRMGDDRSGTERPARDLQEMSNDILARLAETLEARKQADPQSSYVARLYHKGLDAILKKVAEEAAETIMAAKDGVREKVIYETADLWFHSLVLLAQQGIHPDEILNELARREGLSGIVEKASRSEATQ